MKIHSLICFLLIVCLDTFSANRFVVFEKESNAFSLVSDNKIINILIDKEDQRGIHIAVDNLCEDFSQVFGMEPQLTTEISDENCIIVGSLNSKYIKQLIQKEKLEKKQLQGKNEKYIIGEFYQFNLSSCIRQQNSLTAQFVSFSLANLANIFYPPDFYNN